MYTLQRKICFFHHDTINDIRQTYRIHTQFIFASTANANIEPPPCIFPLMFSAPLSFRRITTPQTSSTSIACQLITRPIPCQSIQFRAHSAPRTHRFPHLPLLALLSLSTSTCQPVLRFICPPYAQFSAPSATHITLGHLGTALWIGYLTACRQIAPLCLPSVAVQTPPICKFPSHRASIREKKFDIKICTFRCIFLSSRAFDD